MNQVKCPDCGEVYSENMQSCPNCGCPNDNWKPKQEEQVHETTQQTMKKISTRMVSILLSHHLHGYSLTLGL